MFRAFLGLQKLSKNGRIWGIYRARASHIGFNGEIFSNYSQDIK